ncbi:MAG: peptide ABC transporter substrate-binding protein [Candidatus Viridilinea halotolerans]|uniref:Peptide ABC transporter substrate-binding protein n=1 Tax=Candidatus Viridilinea halotolerans TaxID=2491704 RepID=A0A426TQC1_9CHLR|nr:MAG: peptide ABC transporter substrate-binding protein [Candidatus Viridilinea halotolerans]
MGILARRAAIFVLLALILPILAACSGQPATQAPVRETVVVTAEPQIQVVTATPDPNQTAAPVEEPSATEPPAASSAFTTPHPILSDVRVRQAIAYCTNRPELIASVYPWLSEEQQQDLLMDTFLPKGHWALNTDVETYPFDPEQGQALLEEAGWTGTPVRAHADVGPLAMSFTTTNAQFRQTWSTVFIQQMADCGIQVIPTYAPGSWWFGSNTGLARRDFEMGAFAWVGQADPAGRTLYACNQVPGPDNNWEGQNYMGWCNDVASVAITAANNTLDRDERISQYAIVQEEFAKDMVSLPVFNRSEAYAITNRLQNFRADSTEYYTANIEEWELTEGDTVVIGFTQEPATLWSLIESAAVQRVASFLLGVPATTQYSYDYQAKGQTELSTLESGLAENNDIEVSPGDTVWNTAGEAVELAAGVEVATADGEIVAFDSGTLTMKQLVVTYNLVEGITWEDGEPLKQADLELQYAIDCDPESGAVSYTVCNSIADVEFLSDTSYVVTYHPGVQWPTYHNALYMGYPSHQVIADGRTLAEVPAAEWQTLPEVIEQPLSNGPYVLTSWEKGQSMTFSVNPNYFGDAPAIETVVIKFIADTNQAVAQLLTGEVDVLGSETLGAGAEVQTVLEAAAAGDIQAFPTASATWEHIDFNLNIR